ncbi:tripartite motif-containing protein 16-like, partial [Clarias magur]
FCYLTLDPNTAHRNLILSEKNRAVIYSERKQQYSDHPERFASYIQVLSKEGVCGRCYWEVEWSGVGVYISVSYKDISRKGRGNECVFGCNNQSWSLWCFSSLSFYHNNIVTDLGAPSSSSRIGVYVDHSAGTLSFYSVSDTMKLLHRVHTTFTQPLYAGFGPYCRFGSKELRSLRSNALGLAVVASLTVCASFFDTMSVVSLPLSAGEDTLELHLMDLEMETLRMQIHDLQ